MKYNFKNVALFATAILTIGAFSACSNEIENIDEPQKETKTITFTTTLDSQTPVSRVNYEEEAVEGGIKLKTTWENNDVLYVGLANNTTNTNLKPNAGGYVEAKIDNSSISADGKTATFTLTPDDSWVDGATLNVFYGTKDKTTIYSNTPERVSINFTNLENKSSTSNDNLNYTLYKYDYMFATTTYKDGSITTPSLEHKISVIKFRLKGLGSGTTINQFNLTSTEKVFYTWAYIYNDHTFTYGNENTTHSLHTGATQIAETNGEWDVYVAILPTALTKDKEITINAVDNNSKKYTGTIELPEIVVGKVYVTIPITMTPQTAQ